MTKSENEREAWKAVEKKGEFRINYAGTYHKEIKAFYV